MYNEFLTVLFTLLNMLDLYKLFPVFIVFYWSMRPARSSISAAAMGFWILASAIGVRVRRGRAPRVVRCC
jgi:hypothetical protein